MDSYSKYLEYPEIIEYLDNKIEKGWVDKVTKTKYIIRKGKDAYEQINILGDDGVPMSYHEQYWKSELIDFVILQQDAFDEIDGSTPLERQKFMLDLVLGICDRSFKFDNFEECTTYFKGLINICRQMNYSEFKSENFEKYLGQLKEELKHE